MRKLILSMNSIPGTELLPPQESIAVHVQ